MNKRTILTTILSVSILMVSSCGKDFLEKNAQGELTEGEVSMSDGIEQVLLGAYGIMNGNVNGTWGNYSSAPSQWIFGEMTSDNAHKGSEPTDQPNMNALETYSANGVNDNLSTMWQVYYEGVLRANNVLKLLAVDQQGEKTVGADRAKQIAGEARMLRAHYYFYLWRVFKNIPYVDENTSTEDAKTIPNNTDVLPKIIDDLIFAKDNLPIAKINGEKGRMDQNIAKAYLGKVYLYQKKYPEALVLLKEVIAGKDIKVMPFQNNFDVLTEDGPEVVLASKHAINPDRSGDNANVGDMLSGLNGNNPVGCCGFFQPTIDLVNAYKVDNAGLPMLNNEYRTDPYKSDLGSEDSYTLNVNLRFDPRLDYTVGRRGVRYLDYGVMPGKGWVRDQAYAGPFVGIKTMIPQELFASYATADTYLTALDVNIIRLADVILMAAECHVELNQLPEALALVNSIRERAAKLPPKLTGAGVPAADYEVKPYPVFPDQEYARKAVRFERRLELAMEGHRFFDLVRWGVAKQVIESYSTFEGSLLPSYKGLVFKPTNEYFPIPQDEIDKSGGTLKQNDL
ncbi:RagB/SusD family nutrient uptake outer membrane protein [Sphingobacterium sp. SYP-B4668]|uniref:RagB/SusD family nutrient uptake outer membrane protein n=1 Tax=Sphingobacterium sp. SYP-B4668 TaxID=2996035 RepID=UPI0022DD817C|nr:RagB/SusD family nutrient uptake outer membrane protein [Sphingobacterium sp. SYP-B4668]